jgi:hypothetical protein
VSAAGLADATLPLRQLRITLPPLSGEIAMPASNRIAAAKIVIELDGARVGTAAWVEGGEPVGEVVETSLGPTSTQKKNVTNIRWTPIKIRTGIGMGQELHAWIKAFVARQSVKKNGAIILFGANGKARSRLDWRDGQIIEVVFPGGDAADRGEGLVTLTIQPESTRAKNAPQEPPMTGGKQRPWPRSNFRVALDNIPNDLRRAMRVDDIVIRQEVTEYRDGGSRFPRIVLGRQKVGDVIITLPDGQANELAAWAEDFLVQGHSSDSDERSGTFDYLDPRMQPLFTLGFRHLGIYRLAREPALTGKGAVTKAYLYCEEMQFERAAAVPKVRAAKKVAKKKARKR